MPSLHRSTNGSGDVKTSPQARRDAALYCKCNLVERFFLKIEHFGRIVTRYKRTTRALLSILSLGGPSLCTK
jgi:hypothetical protein